MASNGQAQIFRLSHETSRYLRKAASTLPDQDMRNLAREFAASLEADTLRPPRPTGKLSGDVRGLRYAPMSFDDHNNACPALFEAALGAFPYACWSEFYKETAWTRPFLSRFATGECIGPTGRFASDDIILGLFVLGPDTTYPAHAHAAEEFYIVIAGEAEFQTGADASFIARRPGDVVLHQSNISHAIKTADRPMFAIYGWRGDLTQPSWYRDDMTDETEPRKFLNMESAAG